MVAWFGQVSGKCCQKLLNVQVSEECSNSSSTSFVALAIKAMAKSACRFPWILKGRQFFVLVDAHSK